MDESADVVAVDDALHKLAAMDQRMADVVDLMLFGGLTGQETAEVLCISEATVFRSWRMARAWLQHELRSTPQ